MHKVFFSISGLLALMLITMAQVGPGPIVPTGLPISPSSVTSSGEIACSSNNGCSLGDASTFFQNAWISTIHLAGETIQGNTQGLIDFGVGAANQIEINNGTAAPTITTCGTGSVTSGSRNAAGEVTATGATACTVNWGNPNWSNTPFCTIEDETSAVATKITAISAAAMTVSGLTSGDKFMWVCLGRN